MSKNNAKTHPVHISPPEDIENLINDIKQAALQQQTPPISGAALSGGALRKNSPEDSVLADELKRELDTISPKQEIKEPDETPEEKNRRLDSFFNKTINELLNIKGEDVSIKGEDVDYDINTELFNPFPLSLRKLEAADIPDNERNLPRKKGGADYLRYAVLAVCASVFIYSGANIVSRLINYSQARASYDEIRNIFYADEVDVEGLRSLPSLNSETGSVEVLNAVGKDVAKNTAISSTKVDEFSFMKPKLERLMAINRDVMGWMKITGTRIDYPLVKGEDNDFYLNHNFKREYDWVGSIFADYRCDKDIDNNRNTIFYGHNIQDGQMFREILFFRDNPNMFYESQIEIYTVKGIYVYEVFAFYKTQENYKYIKTEFKDDAEWFEFLNEMQSNSVYWNKNVKLKPEDSIITLSTCTNVRDEDRYALQAVLVEIKNKAEE